MKQRSPIAIFLPAWMLVFAVCLEAKQIEVTADTHVPADLVQNGQDGDEPQPWRYLLHLPQGYEESEKEWPLIFYLHGRSLRGDKLKRVKRYGLPSRLDRRPEFPFIVVSPQLPDGFWPAQSLLDLLDEVTEKYRVDEDRIYLTGVSLGAGGAWYLAAAEPERFAAFAPVCGYGGTAIAQRFENLPIWAFHGANDQITPLKNHQALIDAINEEGGNAKIEIFPEGNHGSVIVPAYANQELYEWFMSHRRGEDVPSDDRPELVAENEEEDVSGEPVDPPKPAGQYEVKKGDTLSEIASRFGISVTQLKLRNGLESDLIFPGQRLRIPE